jgi:UDPglucose 6-dehydrogenase
MKIGIIGLGVVGSACRYGFEKLGHQVLAHDIKLGTTISDVKKSDICYISVPTPSEKDGSCDVTIVCNVVHELKDIGYEGIVAIKSTVKPTTTETLMKETGLRMCFVPEFLRERCSYSDFTENHDLLAVGTHDDDIFDLVVRSHGNYPTHIVRLKPTEAELLKYYSNIFNALRVVFANEFYEVCQHVGADYNEIKNAFINRKTADKQSNLYLDVNENFRGYGGACLPKDTAAMDAFCKEIGLDMGLFAALETENKKFKTTIIGNMRS